MPFEVVEDILLFLSSGDFLRLSLASRTIAALPLSQAFWESRFWDGREMDFISPELEHPEGVHGSKRRDWRLLCDDISALARTSKGLRNRRTLWRLCNSMRRVLVQIKDTYLCGSPCYLLIEPHQPKNSQHWKLIIGILPSISDSVRNRLKPTQRQIVIPEKIGRIFVSFVEVDEISYLSGIRLVSSISGPDVELGYRIPKNEHLAVFNERTPSFSLRGIRAAVSDRGIHALSFFNDDSEVSEWVGLATGFPKIEYYSATSVTILRGQFDDLKLLKLQVPDDNPVTDSEFLCYSNPDLRSLAWFDGVPSPNLNLNSQCFLPFVRDIVTDSFPPLYYFLFGGVGGIHLSKLEQLIFFNDGNGLQGIAFEYNEVVDGNWSHLLGRFRRSMSREVFLVDGKGGERINRVDVDIHVGRQIMSGFRLGTNRDREILINNSRRSYKPYEIAKGSTIIGFYVSQSRALDCLDHVGVISEVIE